jgi:hypothetical protein
MLLRHHNFVTGRYLGNSPLPWQPCDGTITPINRICTYIDGRILVNLVTEATHGAHCSFGASARAGG